MKQVLHKEKRSEISKVKQDLLALTKDSSKIVLALWECGINTAGAFVSFQSFSDSGFYSC